MEGNLMKTGSVAEYLGTTAQTIRNYGYKGLLIPCFITQAGTRYYEEEQVMCFKAERLNRYEKNI